MLLGQPLGAERAAGLLVGDADHLQLAALQRRRCAPAAAAATASAAVWDFMSSAPRPYRKPSRTSRAPRVGRPVLGVGEHGVDVGEVAEHGPVALAAQRRDEVRALGLGAAQLDVEARVLEVAREPLLARALVPRRVDRVEGDQPGQDLGRLLLELLLHQLKRSPSAAAARPAIAPPASTSATGRRASRASAAAASTASCHGCVSARASGTAAPRIAPTAAGPAPSRNARASGDSRSAAKRPPSAKTRMNEGANAIGGGQQRSRQAAGGPAHQRDRVDHRTGRELAVGDRARELRAAHPAVRGHGVGAHQRDDHEAPAERERADLERRPGERERPGVDGGAPRRAAARRARAGRRRAARRPRRRRRAPRRPRPRPGRAGCGRRARCCGPASAPACDDHRHDRGRRTGAEAAHPRPAGGPTARTPPAPAPSAGRAG